MQLRYNYRLYPTRGQRSALARAFGCARVVFNDSLRARQDAYAAGLPYIPDSQLSARLTAAKATPGTGLARRGLRRGPAASPRRPEHGVPELLRLGRRHPEGTKGRTPRSGPARTPGRPSVSPRNARFTITAGAKLRLPKIGDVPVR